MPEHELEKLLGGFAADTLTPEERKKLFTAALHDQQLFNALADEQALKELLADPAVRRRLLQALNQAGPSGAAFSWLNWLRRPATLAYAGGLAVAVLAVVLSTKVYQESLRQATQSAREDVQPVSPPLPAPPASEPAQAPLTDTKLEKKGKIAPAAPEKKEGLKDKSARREKATAVKPLEQEHPGSRDDLRRRSEQDQVQKQAPVKTLEKAAGDETAFGSKLKGDSPSQAAAPELKSRATAPASPPVAGARALFYGEAPGSSDVSMLFQEERVNTYAQPAPEANRPERKMDRLGPTSKAADVSAQVKPLGLRYSFVIQEENGRDREIDAITAKQNSGQAYLTVEANQNAYLQIWKTSAGTPQLLFPEKESGQISLRIAAGQRRRLPMPTGSDSITIRLSRMPFGPVSRQEAVMLGRVSPNQIEETATGQQEQATYIVNQDPSVTAQIAVEVAVDR
ncbi:MAG TPA: hypothetical protein VKB33_06685 [Nitrospira sp.]|nr:hypothetical protein [Nitrospira sp.]